MSIDCSGRLWSLWDMLQEVDPEGVIKAVSLLASGTKRLNMLHHTAVENRIPHIPMELEEFGLPLWAGEKLDAAAANLQMIGVRAAIARLKTLIEDNHVQRAQTPVHVVQQLAGAMEQVVAGFGDEMDGRKIFVMTPQYMRFYAHDGPLFGVEIADAFPNSADDIDDAGKCLALGQPTACVFHLMRAAEGAAAVILMRLGGDPMDEHGEIRPFGSLAQLIETEIDKMKRGPNKDAWMKLKGFMASINRGTRTKVAHPGTTYSEAKAESLIELTKGFLLEAEELLRY